MKNAWLPTCFAVCLLFSADAFSQKGIAGLVAAEKAFASFTLSHTIREGFLQYMDAEGVVFRQGNPVNAIESFQKQTAGKGVLTWQPAYAMVSASGDLGLTTGPYEFRSGSAGDTTVDHGTFSSIWQINKQGEWKNMVDLGVSSKTKKAEHAPLQQIALVSKSMLSPAGFDEILTLDKQFNKAIQEKNSGLFLSQIAPDSWLNMEGETPFRGVQMISNVLIHIPDSVVLISQAGKMAASHDLAYVYGSVTNGNKKENYLRVWANRNKRWQVVLQTIKW